MPRLIFVDRYFFPDQFGTQKIVEPARRTSHKGRSVVSKMHVELEGYMGLTVTQVARLAREIYRDAKPGIKYKQGYRAYICPFHLLVDYIPQGASVLDVGCGAGLFILLMARLGRIRSGV